MIHAPQNYRKKPVVIQAMQWDGTAEGATPGPWTIGAYEPDIYEVVDTDLGPDFGRQILTAIVEEGVCDYDEASANARLASEAHNSVAEVIRLRRAIEAMRDDWEALAERSAALAALRPDERLRPHPAARSLKTHQQVIRRLNRILEGDTNE